MLFFRIVLFSVYLSLSSFLLISVFVILVLSESLELKTNSKRTGVLLTMITKKKLTNSTEITYLLTIHLKVTNAITLLKIIITVLTMVTKIGYEIQKVDFK